MMKSQTGIFAVHVPYRGAAPALSDLLAGQIDFLFDPGIALPHVKAGKLRLLAVGSPKRSPLYPRRADLDEAGLKGFDADTVFGVYAPAGTPAEIIDRLNREVNRRLGAARGAASASSRSAASRHRCRRREFGASAAEDSQRFGTIIQARGIKVE